MTPPNAMRNNKDELLTTAEDILEEAFNHYKNVFEETSINKEFKEYKKGKRNTLHEKVERMQHS